MSTFVLVHGSWHGAWCWERIVPMLEEAGHRVIVIDLPAHGTDHTPLIEVNLKSYTDCLSSVLDKEPEKVILVGHSMAGVVREPIICCDIRKSFMQLMYLFKFIGLISSQIHSRLCMFYLI